MDTREIIELVQGLRAAGATRVTIHSDGEVAAEFEGVESVGPAVVPIGAWWGIYPPPQDHWTVTSSATDFVL